MGRQSLEGDQLTGDESALAARLGRTQPGLGGDAVLVLAEDRLQLGGRSREGGSGGPGHGRNGLGRVARALGQDPDAMELWVGRRLRQPTNGRAQAAPRRRGQRRQHGSRRLVGVRQRLRRMRGGNQPLEQVDVPL